MAGIDAATVAADTSTKAVLTLGGAAWATLATAGEVLPGGWEAITQLGANGAVLALLVWAFTKHIPTILQNHGREIAQMRESFEATLAAVLEAERQERRASEHRMTDRLDRLVDSLKNNG